MKSVDIKEFLELIQSGLAVFDVRTPAEFADGRLPSAQNLPLFTDEERAVVGTLYKREGRHRAILEGLDFIGPRMREIVETVEGVVGPPEAKVLVHCWRGGMRSASVAWLLELYGFQVITLEGGYKAFRRWVMAELDSPPPLLVLGGYTGSGKTEILESLESLGEPVIDLEGLAGHRGSAFGGVLLPEQPTQQEFENRLALQLARVRSADRPVWIEDESRMIGQRNVPKALYDAKASADVLVVEVPIEDRVQRLTEVYGGAPREVLSEGFDRIRKRLGGERARNGKAAIEEGDLAEAARIALQYYDKAYKYDLSRRAPDKVHPIPAKDEPMEIARELIIASKSLLEEEGVA